MQATASQTKTVHSRAQGKYQGCRRTSSGTDVQRLARRGYTALDIAILILGGDAAMPAFFGIRKCTYSWFLNRGVERWPAGWFEQIEAATKIPFAALITRTKFRPAINA